MEQRIILVIENQQTQFETISDFLKHEYIIYPSNEEFEYINFIDKIRIWVNKEYDDGKFRNSCFSNVCSIIENNEVDIVIMDHILGGAYHCLTGIDLAMYINRERKHKMLNQIPVLFLSKTEHNERNRVKKFLEYSTEFSETKWVHKGYFGDEILNEDYFKANVIVEIDRLISKSTYNLIQEFILRKEPLRNMVGKTNYIVSLDLLEQLLTKLQGKLISKEEEIKIRDIITNETSFGESSFDKLCNNLINNLS